MTIGARIAACRKRAGMSQEKLANEKREEIEQARRAAADAAKQRISMNEQMNARQETKDDPD